MLQLKNRTLFALNIAIFPDETSIDSLHIMVKATFNIDVKRALLDVQKQDFYSSESDKSCLRYASEFYSVKIATDIIVIGHAIASCLKKDTVVDGQIDSPEMHNLVGYGSAGLRKSKEINSVRLHKLEDPINLICYYKDRPVSACSGFCAPAWHPGSPYLSRDLNERFLNRAHMNLIMNGFLRGGEVVHITNMHYDGNLNYYGLNLHRILILEPNQKQLRIAWKAVLQCNNKVLSIKKLRLV